MVTNLKNRGNTKLRAIKKQLLTKNLQSYEIQSKKEHLWTVTSVSRYETGKLIIKEIW